MLDLVVGITILPARKPSLRRPRYPPRQERGHRSVSCESPHQGDREQDDRELKGGVAGLITFAIARRLYSFFAGALAGDAELADAMPRQNQMRAIARLLCPV